MKFFLPLCSLILLLGSIAAGAGLEEDLEIAGVKLGMSKDEFFKKARGKGLKLVGPGKGVLDFRSRAQAQEYSVAKNRNLGSWRGLQRQSVMLLNKKVIAVELTYKSKSSFEKFVEDLKDLGFEKGETDEAGDWYTGKMPEGEYAGRKVKVRVDSFKSGGRRRRTKYSVMIRCLEVLGEGITLEAIERAQQTPARKEQPKQGKTGLDDLL